MVVSEETVHLDEVLKKFGAYSRYHIQAILLISFAFFNNGMHCINYVIVAEETPYRCKIEQCDKPVNLFESTYNFTTPPNSRGCYKYRTSVQDCAEERFNISVVEECDDWIYKKNDSFVSEVIL